MYNKTVGVMAALCPRGVTLLHSQLCFQPELSPGSVAVMLVAVVVVLTNLKIAKGTQDLFSRNLLWVFS